MVTTSPISNTENGGLAIVGGGAAGMCAALSADHTFRTLSSPPFPAITLFERNPRLGIKIRISGGGKCNITHAGPMMDVLKKGFRISQEQRFLKPSFFGLSNDQVIRWLHDIGVETYVRENGRIFPCSGKADDVLSAFELLLSKTAVGIHTSTRVTGLFKEGHHFQLNYSRSSEPLSSNALAASAVILATGGVSYSKTGTTGDGIRFAQSLGHTIAPLRAALAPIYFQRPPSSELVGVSLRHVTLIARRLLSHSQHYERITETDDVLITHLGISGPAPLSLSRSVEAWHCEKSHQPIEIGINLFPQLHEAALNSALLTYAAEHPSQHVKTYFEHRHPVIIAKIVLQFAGIDQDQKWSRLTREERQRLISFVQFLPLGVVKEVPIERGEVSAGGVSLREINPQDMASRQISGLFFAGEMIDIAGEVGGFNLQAAYSTGWRAGEAAARYMLHQHLGR